MPKPIDLLAIGAHPDDVEMTSGGWLALAAAQGYRTAVVHLSRGEMGTRGTPAQRVREAKAAAKVLGCAALEFAGLQDGYIQPDDSSVRRVVDLLRKLKPHLVIAPYFQCHHPDHESAAELCVRAVHFAGLKGYKTNLPQHRVHRLMHARYSHAFEPSFYVDVSSVIEVKRAAMSSYAGQFTPAANKPHEPVTRMAAPGFLDQFLSQNSALGLRAGCAFAEAYWMRVAPAFADPISVLGSGMGHHMIR